MTNSTLEKVARALAIQAGCNPDDPAFVRYPGGEAFGVCWRDKYLEPARAALQSLRQVDDETVETMAMALSLADPDERGLPEGEEMAPFYRKLARAAAKAQFDHILGQEP